MISEDDYKKALAIVNNYRKQQNALLYPKTIINTTFKLQLFDLYYNVTQVSKKGFKFESNIIFPLIGFKFSDYYTINEIGLIRFDNPQPLKFEEDPKFLIYFLIVRLSKLKEINVSILKQLIIEFEKQFPWNSHSSYISVLENETGFEIKVKPSFAFCNYNYNLIKIK